jgi:LPXTG-site transpeptidase (sortase) family protein
MIQLSIFLVFIAFLITYITVLGIANGIEDADISIISAPEIQGESDTADVWIRNQHSAITPPIYSVSDTDDPVPTVREIIEKIIPKKHTQKAIAQITIETNRKIRTYDVMEGVDEHTLKKNIGWFPSSAMPGEEGMCVLMGHRDTEFKILKHAEVGDRISVVLKNGATNNYKVSHVEIVESNQTIMFDAGSGSELALVTCYPFRYTGNAPQKIVVSCKYIH